MRARVAAVLFWLYKRLFSPILHSAGVSQCIFLPTCSEYAYVAVVRHGWFRGTLLALRRISRCHPLSQGGIDPVP
jgi:putative membrane protein insertion efficiency factor